MDAQAIDAMTIETFAPVKLGEIICDEGHGLTCAGTGTSRKAPAWALRIGRLNTMTRDEFREMVAIVDRLRVNLTDFNVLHFPAVKIRYRKRTRKANLVSG